MNPKTPVSPNQNAAPGGLEDQALHAGGLGVVDRATMSHLLGVSPRTMARWEALRKGPPVIRLGRRRLYSIDSAKVFLRRLEAEGAP